MCVIPNKGKRKRAAFTAFLNDEEHVIGTLIREREKGTYLTNLVFIDPRRCLLNNDTKKKKFGRLMGISGM